MITEAHKRNYEKYVKPFLNQLDPKVLSFINEKIMGSVVSADRGKHDARLKRMVIGRIMDFIKGSSINGDPNKSLVVCYSPHITLSDIYVGMWYDELYAETMQKVTNFMMASNFLTDKK